MKLTSLFTDKTMPTASLASPQENDPASTPTKRSRKDWDFLIEQWAASGLTQKKFCEQHNLNLKTFKGYRLRQLAENRGDQKLLPIKVSDVVEAITPVESKIVLKLTSGAELTIPPQCDKTALKELFIMLGVC